MTRKIFSKLLGLFLTTAVFQAIVTGLFFFKLEGGMTRALWLAALASGLTAVVAAALAARFSRDLARRLRLLVGLAEGIAESGLEARGSGRRSGPAGGHGGDEISAAAEALEASTMRVKQSFAALETRRAELAALLDSMQEAVVAITGEGSVSWSNAPMQRLAGTQIRQGRPLVHSVRDPEVLACAEGALRARELRHGRATLLAPGRIFEVSAAPLPAGGAVVVLHDVTSVEASERSRRDFIANVSHELRTPLTSISGYLETLLEEPAPKPETMREFLQIILKNSNRMNRLTEDLLELASVESPDYKLTPQPIRASALVEDAIESLAGMAIDSGVALESGGAPAEMVMADPDAMTQVFGNLIENALKYGKSGGRILVHGETRANGFGHEVEFVVRDFGPGIAYEHLNRIFERFYRIDKARSRDSGGTGLGLAIVKHIVEAHGGRLWAESELGAGAGFHFTLPALRRDAGPAASAAAPRSPEDPDRSAKPDGGANGAGAPILGRNSSSRNTSS